MLWDIADGEVDRIRNLVSGEGRELGLVASQKDGCDGGTRFDFCDFIL